MGHGHRGPGPDSKKHVGKYLGMRQRLGLAQAMMEDPELPDSG